ncbi:MAG: T9SS type A sorting domain-containing protein [Bacteroidales bacterium]|nr:T9SS type A sorting domain-containing protein [Bacteroidales bacterium]
MVKKVFSIISLCLLPIGIYSQYAFPNAEGFGSFTRGAYETGTDPRILIVDNLTDNNSGNETTGRGSFRWAITRSYPRIIIFEVGGTIALTTSEIEIESPYMFIAGQTAPSPGILIINGTLHIKSHDIIIQHISVRPGDNIVGQYPDGRDGITMRNGTACHDIIIDHCSLLWAIDENMSTWGGGEVITNFTFSNNIIANGLNNSLHDEGAHSKGLLVGYNTQNVSVIKNYFAHNNDRNPLLQGGTRSEVINNLVYNGRHVIVFSNQADYVTMSSVINNRVYPGLDIDEGCSVRLATINDNSQIYLSGNSDLADDWDDAWGGASHEAEIRVNTPPIASGRVEIWSSDNVNDNILENVGSRSWDRNITDEEVLNSFVTRTGRIIDCVDEEEIPYYSGTVVSASANTVQLAADAEPTDPTYRLNIIEITSGTGAGQRRTIISYNGTTKIATLDSNWDVIPNSTSQYAVIINCANNAGGWNLFPSSSHVLDIPSNPHIDDNGNGFTRLEEWIESFCWPDNDECIPILYNQDYHIDNAVPVGTLVGTLTGEPGCEGQQVRYAISSSDHPGRYSLNSVSGELTLAQSITGNSDETNHISVRVYDPSDESLYTTAQIIVHIIAISDEACQPEISPQTFSLDDTLIVGGIIGEVIAEPGCEEQQLHYEITAGTNSEYYSISSSSGELVLADQINISSNRTDQITVTVSDETFEELSASAIVTINVNHIVVEEPPVDCSPSVSDQRFEIDDTISAGKQIGLVVAHADCEGQVLVYELQETERSDLYNLNSTSGALFLTEELSIVEDREDLLVVRVYDVSDAEVYDLAEIIIDITHVNSEPVEARHSVYIDPGNGNDFFQNGSIVHPYSSWSKVEWTDSTDYFQIRGSVAYEDEIEIGANHVRIDAYGSGDKPVIVSNSDEYAIYAFNKEDISINEFEIIAEEAISGIYLLGEETNNILLQHCDLKESEYGLRLIGGNIIIIRYSSFENGLDGIYSLAKNMDIDYNIFRGNANAINIRSSYSSARIYNNVFYDNDVGIVTTEADLVLYNNIFYLTSGGQQAVNHSLPMLVSDNNIIFPEQDGFIEIEGEVYNTLSDYQDHLGMDLNSFISDPMFNDIASNDFGVAPNSPAIDNGKLVGLHCDFYGTQVPCGDAPEIGLKEMEISTGILSSENIQGGNFRLFPNPSEGYITIEIEKDNIDYSQVLVNDFTGRTVFREFLGTEGKGLIDLNLEHLSAGVYMVLLLNQSGKYIGEKLILE